MHERSQTNPSQKSGAIVADASASDEISSIGSLYWGANIFQQSYPTSKLLDAVLP